MTSILNIIILLAVMALGMAVFYLVIRMRDVGASLDSMSQKLPLTPGTSIRRPAPSLKWCMSKARI